MTPELPAFPCPHCQERAFTKKAVANDAPPSIGLMLTHLHLCSACGENYLSTVHVAPDRTRTETWDYYLDRTVPMRRVRRYVASGAHDLRELAPLFILDGNTVPEAAWRAELATARAEASPLVASEDARTSALIERWLQWWGAATHRSESASAPLRLVEPSSGEFQTIRRTA